MNVPFPPVLLWPFPIALIVLALVAKWTAPSQESDGGLARARTYLASLTPWSRWRIAILGLLWSMSLWKFSLPPIGGQVTDIETGKPVAGAIVVRDIRRATFFGLLAQSDSHQGKGFYFGRVARPTDSRGRYRLPGFVALFPWGLRGLTELRWWVRQPEYVPASARANGVRLAPIDEELGGPRFVTMALGPDENRHEIWDGCLIGVTFDLRLRKAATAQMKAEVLRILLAWRAYMIPTREEIVSAAVSLANSPEGISEEAVEPLIEATGLGPLSDSDRTAMRRALICYCDANPSDGACVRGATPGLLTMFRKEVAP
jgi:hypothetical protein